MLRNLAELCPTVVWEADLVSDALGYLPEEISSKVLKMQLGFFFLLLAKYQGKEVN